MEGMSMKTALALTLVLTALAPAWADVAPNPLTTGGTNLAPQDPTKAVPVTMSWEEVDLYPSAEKNRVEAVFLLKNTGKEDIELTVGFPSYFKVALEDFTAEIDGTKQVAEVRKTGGEGRKKIFTYWLCWPMKFAPGEEHKIKVIYWCKVEHSYDYLMRKVPDDLKSKLLVHSSGYILRTGAGWQGNIGKATIRLHYGDDVKKPNILQINPEKGWTYDDKTNVDTLVLSDFKPESGEFSKSDIAYQFRLTTPAEEANLLFEALKAKKLDPFPMNRLLTAVEKDNVLKLDAPSKEAKVNEILELMVPPAGPRFKIQGPGDEPGDDYLSFGAEMIQRDTFARLLDHYRSTKNTAKADTLIPEYVAFLKVVVARRDKEFFSDPKFQRGQQWEEQKNMKHDLDELSKLLPPEKKG
jgi:hypothetical protein